ncbi:MAG: enoyl-CoA hydratase/carnithine racemase [Alphaproteobacteria bacterium]|jgi:enoyl-CoA hydratase/carnithine racemase
MHIAGQPNWSHLTHRDTGVARTIMSDAATIEETPDAAPRLLREDRGAVATLTLNRPAQMNVLSSEMLGALQSALDDIAGDPSVRVVVLAANGKAFCTGHNLKDMRANYTPDYQNQLFATCSNVMLSILRLPQPVIAKVQGMATAAGCQLVATCDLAVAAHSAKFGTSGINNGLFCSTPGVAVGRNLSRKHAMEMLLTGDFIDPDRAEQIGLINQVVPDNALDTTVDALADKLAAKSAYGLTLGKQAFYRQLEMGITDAYAFTGAEMARNVMDRDAAEGFDAFIEKRAPVWDQSPRDEPDAED